jgi:hypothetical protein
MSQSIDHSIAGMARSYTENQERAMLAMDTMAEL